MEFFGARGGTRTRKMSPPTDFKSVAYTNSATRPLLGGTDGIRTRVHGFADRCVTTPPQRHY